MSAAIFPPVVPIWASGGDTDDAPNDSEINVGWPETDDPPSRQRFNWVDNFLFNAVRYYMQNGLPAWSTDEEYQDGALVIGSDGNYYRCILDSTDDDPTADPTHWELFGDVNAEGVDDAIAAALSAYTTTSGMNSAIASALSTFLGAQHSWSKAQTVTPQTLAIVAGATAVDASLSNTFVLTANADTVIGAPSNPTAQQTISIDVNMSGSHSVTLNAAFIFDDDSPTTFITTDGAKNKLTAQYDGTSWRSFLWRKA